MNGSPKSPDRAYGFWNTGTRQTFNCDGNGGKDPTKDM